MLSLLVRSAVIVCCMASPAFAQSQIAQIDGKQVGHHAVKGMAIGEYVRLEKFELPEGSVDLILGRVSILAEDAEILVGSKEGMNELLRPDVVMLSGFVAGDPSSTAFIAISKYGTNGFVETGGELLSISTGPYAQEKNLTDSLRAARLSDVIDPENEPPACGYEPGDVVLEPAGPMAEYVPSTNRGAPSCRIAGIAIETDWDYTQRLFGGNANAAAAYAVSLMGAVSEIYERDLGVRLSIPFLRVWSDNSDPYNSSGDPLDQVRAEWNTNMGGVDRTVVHFLTGREDTSYGGVAYLSVLCHGDAGYGVSAHLDGSFPYPLTDHHGGNWDLVVVSHELGHNFGTSHTHNYEPVIDGCGNGDCTAAFGGTIMSYCHGCSGGMSNIVLEFHPRVRDVITAFMDSSGCDLDGSGLSALPDFVETLEDTVVEIDAIGNDEASSCNAISLLSFDASSAQGGVVTLLAGQGPGGRDLFEYAPPIGFDGADSFDYIVTDSGSTQEATVSVNVRALRTPVTRIDPIDGLAVEYYALSNPSVLPDFASLTPISTDTALGVSFASTGGEFMNSGRADNVGAVLEGYVFAPFDGIFTFTTESDDGSKLLIGKEVVVDNDGLHGMVKSGGSTPLGAGWHPIRIEFFEAGGGAGLIATINGDGMAESVLDGVLISQESNSPCSDADLVAPLGELNLQDVFAYLAYFNIQDPSADLTEPFGVFNLQDVFAYLDLFNAGCP